MITDINQAPPILAPICKVSKDMIAAIRAGQELNLPSAGVAGHSNATEARTLIDLYYGIQDYRKAIDNQRRAMDQGADTGITHEALDFIAPQIEAIENNARAWLEAYINSHVMWPWFAAVDGIGPILAAGLVAHLGSRPVPTTVGKWHRYAGLDPSQQWLKAEELRALWNQVTGDIEQRVRAIAAIVGRDPATVLRDATTNFRTGETKSLTKDGALKSLARIPYNRPLKTLCWKVGDQFVKLGDSQKAFYAVFYRQRKAIEIARNLKGERAELAAKTLAEKPTHAQKAIYAQGQLPDGRLDLMARRATVKLFLSHLHELWYRMENDGQLPPRPFAFTILHHTDYIPPPHQEALGLEAVKTH